MKSEIKGKGETARGWRWAWGTRSSPRLSQLGLRTSVLGHGSWLTPSHVGNKYAPSSLDLGLPSAPWVTHANTSRARGKIEKKPQG